GRVAEGAVGGERHDAVRGRVDLYRSERITVDVGVVAEDTGRGDVQRSVLQRREAVPDRRRSIVDRLYRDRDGRARLRADGCAIRILDRAQHVGEGRHAVPVRGRRVFEDAFDDRRRVDRAGEPTRVVAGDAR